jgi:hypothetical protein
MNWGIDGIANCSLLIADLDFDAEAVPLQPRKPTIVQS